MIIYFDKYMGMHVDKLHDADNSFALARYGNNSEIFFKANAVVEGNTVLFTHSQVTAAGGKQAYGCYCSNSTGRRHFLKKYLRSMENAIASYLRKEKGYRGKIKVRFSVGESTQGLFKDLGYVYAGAHRSDSDYYWSNKYVFVEKLI